MAHFLIHVFEHEMSSHGYQGFVFFTFLSLFFFFFLGGGQGGGGRGDEGKRGSDQNYFKRQHFEKLYLQTSLKNFAYIYAKTVLIYFYA